MVADMKLNEKRLENQNPRKVILCLPWGLNMIHYATRSAMDFREIQCLLPFAASIARLFLSWKTLVLVE